MKEKYVEATVVVEEFEEDIVTYSGCPRGSFPIKPRCPSSNDITDEDLMKV